MLTLLTILGGVALLVFGVRYLRKGLDRLFGRRLAAEFGKPHLVVDPEGETSTQMIREWLAEHGITILNVAGPRESSRPGIYERAAALLRSVLG